MTVQIISQEDGEITIQMKVSLKGSMLEMEQSILEGINRVGVLATGEALKKFDTDGEPIVVGNVKLTSRDKNGKSYQTPYGVVRIERHVYQTSKGGAIYVPLESAARIIQGATPRFAKMLSHKYSNLPAPVVIEDLVDNHDRKMAISYLQNVTDYVGSIAQAKEEVWAYECPILDKPISTLGISLDGAYINTIDDGFREGMSGTVSFYDKAGERLHTIYIGAAPEYGKESFLARFECEIIRAKALYPDAKTIGVTDGAQSNGSFLENHTSE